MKSRQGSLYLPLVATPIVGLATYSAVAEELYFQRGDSNADNRLDMSDAVGTLSFLFLGKGAPTCLDAANANDDGVLGMSDAIFILHFLFLGGRPPSAPSGQCGLDPTRDMLSCQSYPHCLQPTVPFP